MMALIEQLRTGMRDAHRWQWPLLLVWSCLLLLPVGRLVELPVALMALAGIYLLIRQWRRFRDDAAARMFAAVFLLAWIPMLVSLPDAVNPDSTGRLVLNHLRFAFGGVFIIYALATPAAHQRFVSLCAWVLLAWVGDGLVQMAFGRDLLGFAAPPGRINALFGEESLAYPIVLSVLCPLLWEHAARHWARWQLAAVVVATLAVLLAAGARSTWISMAVIVLAYGVVLWRHRGRFPAGLFAAGVAGVVVVVAILWSSSDRFSHRLENAIGAMTGDTPIMQDAIGHRFWIWKGALNMIDANPANGVGAGGFRYAFGDYAAEGDPFVNADPPIHPYHAHQLWLQTLSETGVPGALGLAALLVVLVVMALRAPPETRDVLRPYAVCLLVAYFPFNSHMAIYSSFWSQIVWWLIALLCAAYGVRQTGNRRANSD